ncbi:L,D-transpeptidase [uncultured Bifidobacterium sp.]|uniref:L,D-transpeptidase n=1 Tax=uncultured Bifidobacterium sp. TaxID=165187 RepID=UPI0028DC5492|nr:L,D-transpeptidase [uncultured Bifidobacterium sp.]
MMGKQTRGIGGSGRACGPIPAVVIGIVCAATLVVTTAITAVFYVRALRDENLAYQESISEKLKADDALTASIQEARSAVQTYSADDLQDPTSYTTLTASITSAGETSTTIMRDGTADGGTSSWLLWRSKAVRSAVTAETKRATRQAAELKKSVQAVKESKRAKDEAIARAKAEAARRLAQAKSSLKTALSTARGMYEASAKAVADDSTRQSLKAVIDAAQQVYDGSKSTDSATYQPYVSRLQSAAKTVGDSEATHQLAIISQDMTLQTLIADGRVDLSQYSDLSLDVSIANQRVYVKSNGMVIYEMIASTGLYGPTPTGDYTINGYRGYEFHDTEGWGGRYWVGFIKATYLFHSVPIDENGNYVASEAAKLGQPASHGCVRLSLTNAKWLYEYIPTGTPVHVA